MAKTTTDHDTIRRWVEARGGCPAHVKRTGKSGDPGILRIDFPGYSGQKSLEPVSWDVFFQWFDKNQLALIYQDRTRGGQPSRFNKLVRRDNKQPRRGGVQPGHGAEPIDALEMLESQHRAVEELFFDLSRQGRDGADFRETFIELADMIAMHDTIETRHFYPAVKAADTGQDEELQHYLTEHLEVKRVLATLLATSQSDPDLLPKVEELEGLLEEHVIEEEHELFPRVRRLMDREQLIGLAQEMASTMVQLQQQGDPRQNVPGETDQPARI